MNKGLYRIKFNGMRRAVLLALILLMGVLCLSVSSAYAAGDTADVDAKVSSAAKELDSAQARMAELENECEELQSSIDELQDEIDDTSAELMEVQTQLLDNRDKLSSIASYQYREGGYIGSIVSLFFDAENFTDLINKFYYLDSLMAYQSEEIETQQQISDEFQALLDELNAQKDEQDEKLLKLEDNLAEAESLVAQAKENLADAKAEQAKRVAELEAQAAAMAAAQRAAASAAEIENSDAAAQSAGSSDSASSGSNSSSAASSSSVSNASASSDSASSSSGSTSSSSSSSDSVESSASSASSSVETGWKTGLASAYGGSTDSYTGKVSYTATGAICDDNSMGVAIPMAWSGYWKYYGRTIEISYNGMTVVTVINDCGYLSGGARSLDLQPGVWKAFGFSSCNDWGVRTVSYRIL